MEKEGVLNTQYLVRVLKETQQGVVVELIEDAYTDRTTWYEYSMCDKFIKRCVITHEGLNALGVSAFVKKDLLEKLKSDEISFRDIETMSAMVTSIDISLPVRVHGENQRIIRNTSRPVLVKINGKDYSHYFESLDMFTTERVEAAYCIIYNHFPDTEKGVEMAEKLLQEAKHTKGLNLLARLGVFKEETKVLENGHTV